MRFCSPTELAGIVLASLLLSAGVAWLGYNAQHPPPAPTVYLNGEQLHCAPTSPGK